MAQKKAHEVDAWIARPDPAFSVVLVYGPDHGLVSERAQLLASRSGVALDDPFSVSRLDASELDRQPGRLIDEAGTVPMFADRRLVWVRGGGSHKSLADDVRAVCEQTMSGTLVLIEAGDLRKTAPLRMMVEAAPFAMALPCYADEKRGIQSVIEDELRGFRVEPDAADLLLASLGGDRLMVRSELRKLAAYLAGRDRVTREDVEAVTADVPLAPVDAVVDAVLAGHADAFERSFARAAAAGQGQAVLLAVCRVAVSLHQARGAMEERRIPPAAATAAIRPPLYGPRRALVEQALARYSLQTLSGQLGRLHEAILEMRRRPELGDAIARQSILAFVAIGRRKLAA